MLFLSSGEQRSEQGWGMDSPEPSAFGDVFADRITMRRRRKGFTAEPGCREDPFPSITTPPHDRRDHTNRPGETNGRQVSRNRWQTPGPRDRVAPDHLPDRPRSPLPPPTALPPREPAALRHRALG